MGGGKGVGLDFGATYGSGQLPLEYKVIEAKKTWPMFPKNKIDKVHRNIFPNCSTKINFDSQGKHILGHKNYQEGKSYLII